MKSRTFVSIPILVLALLIIAGSCATGKKAYVASDDEKLYGIWINPDYDEKAIPGRIIYEPKGVARSYCAVSDTEERLSWKFTIADKWIDDEGTIWYKLLISLW
jgi:hypothetical protein